MVIVCPGGLFLGYELKWVGGKNEFLGCELDAAPKMWIETDHIDSVEPSNVRIHATGDR